MGADGGPGLRSPPAMEQVQMINIQRLLEAAEYLERRERGNGGRMGALREGNGAGVRSPQRGESDPEKGSEPVFAGGMVVNPQLDEG